MSIENANFEVVGEADLEELLQGQVTEGLRVEYKRELYGNTDAEKREALKDISAFANARGGHLIIGVEEEREKGVYSSYTPGQGLLRPFGC